MWLIRKDPPNFQVVLHSILAVFSGISMLSSEFNVFAGFEKEKYGFKLIGKLVNKGRKGSFMIISKYDAFIE